MDFHAHKKVEDFLGKLGVSTSRLDYMWFTLNAEGHPVVSRLVTAGNDWRDLNEHVVKTIPIQFNKSIDEG